MRIKAQRLSMFLPRGDGPFQVLKRINENAYKLDLPVSVDLLEVPLGPMTRARAKRFKKALHVLIRDAHDEEARVFNSKKETKMVHIIKLNPDLDQEPSSF